MTKVILVAHGDLGSSFLRSVVMIAGEQNPDEIAAVNFSPDDSRDDLQARIEEILIRFEPKENHVVICCDLKAGSPFNASYLLSKKYPIHIVSGMNLPLLLEFILMKDSYADLDSLNGLVDASKESISVL